MKGGKSWAMNRNTAFEIVGDGRVSDWIVLCDHASNRVPEEVGGDLGLPAGDMARHIAWDPGARGVSVALAEALGAPMIASRFSRLVIDPNRAETDPTLLRRIYDGSVIPGNRHADAAEKERRLNLFHRPYHAAVKALIDGVIGAGRTPRLVSIHSFTPQLINGAKRPWHIGLLWDRDDRIFRPLWERLRHEPELTVGDNEPYTGQLPGDCMWTHGTARGLPHILIEVRNDLIETEESQAVWGADLARWLRDAMEESHGRTDAA